MFRIGFLDTLLHPAFADIDDIHCRIKKMRDGRCIKTYQHETEY